MEQPTIRILVVDDYEPWRRFICSMLQNEQGFGVVGQASDGLDAIQKAKQLQPDLIILDIGLPILNGIEAARLIRKASPKSKILFVSQEQSPAVVDVALKTGAGGYILKMDSGAELFPAVKSLLRGGAFLGSRFKGNVWNGQASAVAPGHTIDPWPPREVLHHHEVEFHSDDRSLMTHLSQFIGPALKVGNAAIVIATQAHRDDILLRLEERGLHIDLAIQQGRYVALDANDALATFMVGSMPDPVRFEKAFGRLILETARRAKSEHPRVAIFGEGVHLLWAQGNSDAAIKVEKLCNELTKRYDVNILCGYCPDTVPGGMSRHFYEQVCSEHSAIYSR